MSSALSICPLADLACWQPDWPRDRRCASPRGRPALAASPRWTCDHGTGTPDPSADGGCATLPIGRVVGPADIAALAVHLMTNTALTGATYDIDGGQQLISGG